MESDWRQNVELIGWGGKQMYLPGVDVEVMLAAKLISSIPFGAYTLTHIVKLCGGGSCGAALASQSFDDPVQTEGFFPSVAFGHFPYGYAVFPD